MGSRTTENSGNFYRGEVSDRRGAAAGKTFRTIYAQGSKADGTLIRANDAEARATIDDGVKQYTKTG